jgi:hypothetical protein
MRTYSFLRTLASFYFVFGRGNFSRHDCSSSYLLRRLLAALVFHGHRVVDDPLNRGNVAWLDAHQRVQWGIALVAQRTRYGRLGLRKMTKPHFRGKRRRRAAEGIRRYHWAPRWGDFTHWSVKMPPGPRAPVYFVMFPRGALVVPEVFLDKFGGIKVMRLLHLWERYDILWALPHIPEDLFP